MKKVIVLTAALFTVFSSVAQAKDDADILGFPSSIPHAVDSYLPITPEKNMCIMCHREQKGTRLKKGEIPHSHFINHQLDASRHECLLCHTPVTTQEAPKVVDPNAAL